MTTRARALTVAKRDVAPNGTRIRMRPADRTPTAAPDVPGLAGRWPCAHSARCSRAASRAVFHGVHVLPPFPSSGDRGFAPLTYDEIDPRFGTWDDIRRIAAGHDVLLDLMINHISRQSQEFQDFQRHGRRSAFADLFITIDKVWPDGSPRGRHRPDLPAQARRALLDVTIEDTGEQERVWTSFGTADWSEQIDLDVTSPRDPDLDQRAGCG